MLTRSSIAPFVGVLAMLASAPALAQDLFREPGKPALIARDIHLTLYGDYVGQDAAGWLYYEGGTTCHHPDDPTKQYYLDGGTFVSGSTHLRWADRSGALLADGSGVELAYTTHYPDHHIGDKEALRVWRFSCADLAPGGRGATRVGGDILTSHDPLLANGLASAQFVRTSAGLCFPTRIPVGLQTGVPLPGERARIACLDVDASPVTVTSIVDAADFDGALRPSPGLAYMAADRTAIDQGWTISGLASAPGGRLFFFATRTYWYDGFSQSFDIGYSWIVERRADGSLVPRFGPFQSQGPGGWSPLYGAKQLLYHAGLDAMLIGPVLDQENNWASSGGGGITGWTGIGFAVLPLDAAGLGYLPLGRPFFQRTACTNQIPCYGAIIREQTKMIARGDAVDLMLRVPNENPNIPEYEIFELRFDPATLDLDHDGLAAADEAAAGTSDTLADSDAGGTPDVIEVAVTGTDARAAAGEPAMRNTVKGWVRYVPSTLIEEHAAGVGGARTIGVDGPMCGSGVCHDPEGEVARYPTDRTLAVGSGEVVARDGSFIMIETEAGLERFFFEDGSEELAIARADFENIVPCEDYGALHIFPIDRERTWLACDGRPDLGGRYVHPARIAYADGGPPVVVYDHARAQRDSGLSPATDDFFEPLEAGVMATITPIGWIEETGRFELAVRGNWETYLIALTPDGTASLIGRARGLKGMNTLGTLSYAMSLYPPAFPTSLVPTGHGDYFADGAIMTPYNGLLPGYATWNADPNKPVTGAWGDVLVDQGAELVRYERDVRPGDVLILRAESNIGQSVFGATLYKSGPRGGMVDLWGPEPSIGGVAGMDIARDGSMRMCVADDVNRVVWEFEPAGPEGPPEIMRWVEDVPYVLDCAYDDDGALRVLTIDDVLVRDSDFGVLVQVEEVPVSPAPIELMRDASGKNVVRAADGLRGRLVLADGREATMSDDDFTLEVGGEEAFAFTDLLYQSATTSRPVDYPGRIAFAERADGTVVFAPHHAPIDFPYATSARIHMYDPASGQLFVYGGEYQAMYGLDIAVVPGGSAADPWTGDLPAPRDLPPGAPSIDESSSAASFDPSADEGPRKTDEGDCDAGGATLPGLLGLVALASFMRRRRRGG